MKLSRRIEEEILLLKIRHSDQQAFAVVYDRYVDPLYRYVSFRVRSPELAQDLSSELFLKVWQHLTSERAPNVLNLRAYLYQVARNLVADYYRTAQETLPLDEALEVSGVRGNVASVERNVTLGEVERAIAKLKPEWQEVVLLAHVEGLKPGDIAPIIGRTPVATRVLLHRALAELKRILVSGSDQPTKSLTP